MSNLRDQVRRRLELNPLTTSISPIQQPHQTPASGISSNPLSAQFGYTPLGYTPISAVPASAARQYNPQQWGSSPNVSSAVSTQYPSRPQDSDGREMLHAQYLSDLRLNPYSCRAGPSSIFPTTQSQPADVNGHDIECVFGSSYISCSANVARCRLQELARNHFQLGLSPSTPGPHSSGL